MANIKAAVAGKVPSMVYIPGRMWVMLPLDTENGASQLIGKDGEPRIVGPEETIEIKGDDLMVTIMRDQLHLP